MKIELSESELRKELVKQVKKTIKELQAKHKDNIKYRPYAQDIAYENNKSGNNYHMTAKQVQQILIEEKIKIEQPKDPNAVPKELVKAK